MPSSAPRAGPPHRGRQAVPAASTAGREQRRARNGDGLEMTTAAVGALHGAMVLAACLVLVTGCASAPPTPVTSVDPLVGRWSGTVNTGRQFEDLFYLTVNPDGTIVAQWGQNWSWGKITVASGRATYEMTPPPLEGTVRFYQGGGRPTMYLDDLFAEFHAFVRKQE
jgi:hypothetical protein